MSFIAAPALNDVAVKLQALIQTIVPTGTPILRGPLNRVAQPAVDHVLFVLHGRRRLRTNVETDFPPVGVPDDGTTELEQGIELRAQVDFYGLTAEDWVDPFTTLFRSEYACNALAPECQPLYADDGRMMPLVTGEEQYLTRWCVQAMLQYNPVTTTPQQFADVLVVDVINVDERYPP